MVMRIAFILFFYQAHFSMELDPVHEIHRTTHFPPNNKVFTSCSRGWLPFGNMCYKIGRSGKDTFLPWEKASEACKDYSGNLVTIDSQELQEFLNTYMMLAARETVWIGLHDRNHDDVYTWEDGTPVSYTNWLPGEPSNFYESSQEDCVDMFFEPGAIGKWNDENCNTERMFICQKEKDAMGRRFRDPRYCSPSGGWTFQESCFHIFQEKKTWFDAEEYCAKTFQGHLVTIPDFTVNSFLHYLLRNQTEAMWIGIKIKGGVQQTWSSGWLVGYENWSPDEEVLIDQSCSFRGINGYWMTESCQMELSFICEESAVEPPVLKPAPEGHFCPREHPGWRDFGGEYCYFIETKKPTFWPMANFLCTRRGGTLASIHSREELNALRNFVRYMQPKVFIGYYRHTPPNDNEFVWLDGSSSNFTWWDVNEPSSVSEICTEIITSNMKWNDIDCGEQRGYICSVLKMPPNDSVSFIQHPACFSGYSFSSLIGVMLCVTFVAILVGIVVYYFCAWDRQQASKKKASGILIPSPSSSGTKPKYRSSEIVLRDDSALDKYI